MTLQDHVVKVLYDFMIKSLTRYITILASLVAIDIVPVEIQRFLFVMWSCKTTWSKHKITLWLEVSQSMPPFYQVW